MGAENTSMVVIVNYASFPVSYRGLKFSDQLAQFRGDLVQLKSSSISNAQKSKVKIGKL